MDTLQLTRGAVAAFRCVVPARPPARIPVPSLKQPPPQRQDAEPKVQHRGAASGRGGGGGRGREPPGLQGRVAGPGAATRDAGAWRRGDKIERPQPIGTALGSEQGPGRQKMFLPRISSGPRMGSRRRRGGSGGAGGQMRISERTEEKQHGEEGASAAASGRGGPRGLRGDSKGPQGKCEDASQGFLGGGRGRGKDPVPLGRTSAAGRTEPGPRAPLWPWSPAGLCGSFLRVTRRASTGLWDRRGQQRGAASKTPPRLSEGGRWGRGGEAGATRPRISEKQSEHMTRGGSTTHHRGS